MRYKTLIIIALIVIALIVAYFFNANQKDTLVWFLNTSGITMERIEDFSLTNIREKKIGSNYLTRATFKNASTTIIIKRLDDITFEFAERYVDEKIISTDSLFAGQDAPYPGVITRLQTCPKEFFPTFHENRDGSYRKVFYKIFSNDRFTYGLCSEDLITQDAILSYLYCNSEKKLFTVEIFSPRSPTTNSDVILSLIDSLFCSSAL